MQIWKQAFNIGQELRKMISDRNFIGGLYPSELEACG